jgi:fumarate hydratase class II
MDKNADVSQSFSKYCVEGLEVNRKRIDYYVDRSLMLVTALSPVIGYDKCAKLAHYAQENDLSLREANQKLPFVSDDQFENVIRPEAMTKPEVVHIQQSKSQASKETLQASS